MASTVPTPSPKAAELAKIFIDGNPPAMQYRLDLLAHFSIPAGARVLELGCGQGDMTTALADAVGPTGHIDAVDPGAPDYGAPFTLAQAHDFLLNGPFGARIAFHHSTPEAFLAALGPDHPPYDAIVLSHCIWYFETPAVLTSILTALPKAKLCIAEWSLRATRPEALPHVIGALLLATLEAKRASPSTGNVRTVLSPAQITREVHAGGWKLAREIFGTGEGMRDGYWEVSDLLNTRDEKFAQHREEGLSESEIGALAAMYDAMAVGVEALGGVKKVSSMDWWAGVFEV